MEMVSTHGMVCMCLGSITLIMFWKLQISQNICHWPTLIQKFLTDFEVLGNAGHQKFWLLDKFNQMSKFDQFLQNYIRFLSQLY